MKTVKVTGKTVVLWITISHRLARLSSGPFFLSNFIKSGVNRPMDRRILNFFARISDSKRYCSGFPDTAIAADCGFIHFFGPGF